MAAEPGFVMRAIMTSPKDVAAGTIAVAAICAIVGNAIFMQTGRHPSPIFGPPPAFSNAAAPSIPNPLPRPRTLEAVQASERGLDSRLFDNKPSETRAQVKAEPKPDPRAEPNVEPKADKADARPADPMANLIRHAATPRPPVQARPTQGQAMTPPAPQMAANPGAPRPPAPVPTASRGDPLADLISRGR